MSPPRPAQNRPRAGRRPRRERGSLSREEIVAAGLGIARADDLSRLTMQRLGAELGVTGMAIYRHFRNKQELLDGILDHFTREASVTSHAAEPSDWQAWMLETFAAMYRALAETPGVLPFVASSEAWRFGPAATEVTDVTLGVLEVAGFSRRAAAEIYWTALSLTVGGATLALRRAADESPSTSSAERRRLLEHSFAGASSEKTPNVVRSAPELAAVALSPRSFEDGLAAYLDAASRRL